MTKEEAKQRIAPTLAVGVPTSFGSSEKNYKVADD
jgi:hypothetical protein